MSKKILIVEDEEDLTGLLVFLLQDKGYKTYTYSCGREALKDIPTINPDLIILDIMLPDIKGFEICSILKKDKKLSSIPIIFLTAKSDEMDIIYGINLGCDDYITKPFDNNYLTAKIKGYISRKKPNLVTFAGITLNKDSMQVDIDEKKVSFTVAEFKLLNLFLENRSKVFEREKIYESINLQSALDNSRTIDTLVAKIRKKLGKYSTHLETVFGIGYRFKNENE